MRSSEILTSWIEYRNPRTCATGLFTAVVGYNSVYAHINIEDAKRIFLNDIDFVALKEHAEMWGTLYTESTFWFDLHYLVFGLLLAISALLIANAVWKARLMKGEARLLEKGRRAAG